MDNKHKHIKKTAAIIALILIATIIIVMIYGTLTHNTSLIMAAIFCLVVIPAMIYLFLLLLRISKRE